MYLSRTEEFEKAQCFRGYQEDSIILESNVKKKTSRYGLALEGGGAKGAFHMGAYKALCELGYDFGAVAGTSIGALNGAIIAQGDFETGYKWWEKMDTSMLFDIEKSDIEKHMNKNVSSAMLRFWTKLAKDLISNRGLDTKKIRDILSEVIDEDRIRNSKMHFGLVTVSVSDWKPLELFKEDIPKGKMIDYLMASANLPAFKIEPIDGKYFLDGGFYDNCPVNILAKKGYKEIFAIRTFGLGRIRKIDYDDIDVVNIYPSKDLGKIIFFDNNTIRENLKMGYCDVMKNQRQLRGREYYIEPDIDEEKILHQLIKLPQKDIAILAESMGFSKNSSQRFLLEKILPELAQIAGLQREAQYSDIVIGVLENAAKCSGIEQYKIYNISRLAKEVRKSIAKKDNKRLEAIPTRNIRKQRRNAILSIAAEVFLDNLKL